MRHPLVTLLVPEGLLVLVAAGLLRWDAALAPAAPFLPAYPVLVVFLGVALAVRFGRSAVLLGLAALALADRALVAAPESAAVRDAVALLLPLNLAALGALPERGLLTAAALRRVGALVAQVAVVVLLARPEAAAVAGALAMPLLPPGLTAWTRVGDLALLAFAGGAALCGAVLVRRSDPMARGFLWALVAALLAFGAPAATPATALPPATFLFATAGLVLATAVVEASHAMAYRDALTGLPSRRALDETLRALDGPFTVAMVDVDHFKRLNDTYGHEVGDQVLRMVAAALARVGAGGRPFRYGGEEFAVLFPGLDAAACLPALEAVRAAIEDAAFVLRAADRPRKRPRKPKRRQGGRRVRVTVSVGLAERTAPDTPPADALRAADRALYRAKDAGRNRVVAAGARD